MIIAEAGINHNGDYDKARKLIEAAKYAGADAVKFQIFWDLKPELKEYELIREDFYQLSGYCKDLDLVFLATPHTYNAIRFVTINCPMIKVASPHLTDRVFLSMIASYNKPIILSTGSIKNENGMATIDEINDAIKYLHFRGNRNIILMHCISKYPCKDGLYKRIKDIYEYTGKPTGLSDHTQNIELPKGLPIYEKHIKLDDNCIDAKVSLDPNEFKRMVEWLKSS